MSETASDTSTLVMRTDDGLTRLVRERLGKRFFHDLADAVRDHETQVRGHALGVQRHDEALYSSLRRICGEL